jgi:hypothetical protein
MKPIRMPQVVVTVIAVICSWAAVNIFGPLDSIPRLRANAVNTDRTLSVKVYKKRLSSFSTTGVGILVRVYDGQNNLLYDKVVFEDGWWDADVGEMYSKIVFAGDEIKIGPKFSPDDYFVIKKSDLNSL